MTRQKWRDVPACVRVPFAALVASLAAGPLALLLAMAVSLGDGVQNRAEPITATLELILVVAAFGAVLAIVPNLVGTFCLFQLSQNHPSVRPVRVWAAVGGMLGIPVSYLIGFGDGGPPMLLIFVLVGTLCATICRLIAAPD